MLDGVGVTGRVSHDAAHTNHGVSAGFVEKEVKKANIPIMDTGENPEVPFPRDMIDLEVMTMCWDLAEVDSRWGEVTTGFRNHSPQLPRG